MWLVLQVNIVQVHLIQLELMLRQHLQEISHLLIQQDNVPLAIIALVAHIHQLKTWLNLVTMLPQQDLLAKQPVQKVLIIHILLRPNVYPAQTAITVLAMLEQIQSSVQLVDIVNKLAQQSVLKLTHHVLMALTANSQVCIRNLNVKLVHLVDIVKEQD